MSGPSETPTLDEVDLVDADVWEQATPHAWFDLLRKESPVHWHPEPDGPGFWAVTKHELVREISTQPLDYSSWVGGPIRLDGDEGSLESIRMIIIGMDPPEHRMFRNIVAKAFTPKMIGNLRDSLRAETVRVIGELKDKDQCDFVPEVAARIPMWVISELMGVPESDRQRLYELSHALIDDQDPEVAPTPDTRNNYSAEIFGYANELAARERANPTGSVTSTLLAAEVDGRKLTDMEYTLFFMFLIVAGNETTRTASSHGLISLLDHRDQMAEIVANPALIPGAVEEILRWEPPIHHFRRTATKDLELGGTKIAEGDKVIMWYPGSNRDESIFDNSHTFDIHRTPNAQQAFGIGEHFCLGANLARLSLQLLFGELLEAVTDIELAAPPRRLHSNLINGIKELQIGYKVR